MFTRKPGRARYEFLLLFTRQKDSVDTEFGERRCMREQKSGDEYFMRSTNVIGKEERTGCHQPVQVEIE